MGGYQLLGKKMSKKGIIITIVIMLVMGYVSNWIGYAIVEANVMELDFMTAFWRIQRYVSRDWIDGASDKKLVMLYVFMAIGAVPTIKKYFKFRKLEEEKKKGVSEKKPGSEPQPGPEPKYSYAEGSVSVSDSVKERVVLGTLGAFVGALIGTICIAILGQFGYIDSIGGVVMGFCAMGGYQLLGKKMSKKGIIITIVIMLVMVYVSNWISYAIVWADVWEEDFMTAFWSIQRRVRIGLIKGYYKNLVMLYVFMASGAVPTIKKYFK